MMSIEIEKETKELVGKIAMCNENIENFLTKFNEDDCYDSFDTDKKIPIEKGLEWLAANECRDWFRNCKNSNLAIAVFWNNARKAFMKRLVALNEREAA